MREFKRAPFYDIVVDLDNPETYKHLPQTVSEVDDIMFKEIGYAYCYFTYFHPYWDKKQVKRIKALIKNYTENKKYNWNNLLWFQEQVFIFQDETENMC